MTTKLVLSQLIKGLGSEPLLHGATTAAAKKSFQLKIRAIQGQLTAQRKVLLKNKTDQNVIITIQNNDPEPPPPSDNAIYKQILELLTSLEEDCFRLQNGLGTPSIKREYTATEKELKTTLTALATSLGA